MKLIRESIKIITKLDFILLSLFNNYKELKSKMCEKIIFKYMIILGCVLTILTVSKILNLRIYCLRENIFIYEIITQDMAVSRYA